MGRHPDCGVYVDDMYVSLRHFAISASVGVQQWHLECLSQAGVLINGVLVGKGKRRSLKHGDAIAVMTIAQSGSIDRKPFIAYRFEVSDGSATNSQESRRRSA